MSRLSRAARLISHTELNGADGLIEQRLDPLAIIELTKK
jgi:hypothetical protein